MGNVNRREILAIVLGSVAILGVVVAGGFTAAAATASNGLADASASNLAVVQDEDGEENETDGQETDRTPITEAMEAAQSETEDRNGTVVGAEFGPESGLLDFGGDGNVYTVDVLLANGTHVEVAVNATNGSIVGTEQQEDGFLEGVFGEDNVPDRPLNLSAMYNATEAVELVRNETGENGTVTSVKLDDRDGDLVYDVQIDRGDDETTVVVDAMKDGQGVVEVDAEQTGGEETEAGAGNETGDGDG